MSAQGEMKNVPRIVGRGIRYGGLHGAIAGAAVWVGICLLVGHPSGALFVPVAAAVGASVGLVLGLVASIALSLLAVGHASVLRTRLVAGLSAGALPTCYLVNGADSRYTRGTAAYFIILCLAIGAAVAPRVVHGAEHWRHLKATKPPVAEHPAHTRTASAGIAERTSR